MGKGLARVEERQEREIILAALEELRARLITDLSPERIGLLTRGELAKVVHAAVQAYMARNGLNIDAVTHRDLITALIKDLLDPVKRSADSDDGAARPSFDRSAVEAAKARIQPLVLEHMDVAAAAEMPRAVFEAQLSGWIKDLLTEIKIQLDFVEQRELVASLIADMFSPGSVTTRRERFEARISSEQKALFKRAADLQGRTLTDFVIASAHDAAVRTIEEMEVIRLSAADSRAFAEALLNPRQPSAELRAAAQRYRKMVGQ